MLEQLQEKSHGKSLIYSRRIQTYDLAMECRHGQKRGEHILGINCISHEYTLLILADISFSQPSLPSLPEIADECISNWQKSKSNSMKFVACVNRNRLMCLPHCASTTSISPLAKLKLLDRPVWRKMANIIQQFIALSINCLT